MKKVFIVIICVVCLFFARFLLAWLLTRGYHPARPRSICKGYSEAIESFLILYAQEIPGDTTNIQVSIQDLIDNDYMPTSRDRLHILTDYNKKFEIVEENVNLKVKDFEIELQYDDETYLCNSSNCVKK